MTIILRTQRDQEAIEGRKPIVNWSDDDYAVLDDETRIGRMYRERQPSGVRWRWFLQIMGASPNSGVADTLDEAKAAIAASYEAGGRPP
jgi:hypothetical protein